jgi:hypothetical protein
VVGLSAEPMEASAADIDDDRPTPNPTPQERGGEFAAPRLASISKRIAAPSLIFTFGSVARNVRSLAFADRDTRGNCHGGDRLRFSNARVPNHRVR